MYKTACATVIQPMRFYRSRLYKNKHDSEKFSVNSHITLKFLKKKTKNRTANAVNTQCSNLRQRGGPNPVGVTVCSTSLPFLSTHQQTCIFRLHCTGLKKPLSSQTDTWIFPLSGKWLMRVLSSWHGLSCSLVAYLNTEIDINTKGKESQDIGNQIKYKVSMSLHFSLSKNVYDTFLIV